METKLKIKLAPILRDSAPVIVELGCGPKKKPGRIGVDRVDMPGVDIVTDLEKGLGFLPDMSVDEIHCRSMLEHIENFQLLMEEIVRVLKPDGKAFIFVPHFSSPYYYSDFTHRRFFGLYTFYYFVNPENQRKRKVPVFYSDLRIEILSLKLKFRSSFKLLNPFRKLFGRIINLHPRIQDYYEENWCYRVPCKGIELVFARDYKHNNKPPQVDIPNGHENTWQGQP